MQNNFFDFVFNFNFLCKCSSNFRPTYLLLFSTSESNSSFSIDVGFWGCRSSEVSTFCLRWYVTDWEGWPTKTTVCSIAVDKSSRPVRSDFLKHLTLSTQIHNLDSGLVLDFFLASVLLQFPGFFASCNISFK